MSYARKALTVLRTKGIIELFRKCRTLLKRELSPIIRWWRYGRHYDVGLPGSHRHIWVNPNDIYIPKWKPVNKSNWNNTHIIDGDWDSEKLCFENTPFNHQSNPKNNVIYKSLFEHFNNGIEWQDTELFSQVVHDDTYWLGVQTEKEFQEKYKKIDNLFMSMKHNGYKTYECRNNCEPKYPKEIMIMIGRDGTLFFVDGKHRLSIAKILNIDTIAVNVIVRHKTWQNLRDEVHKNGLPEGHEDLYDHPDLQDVLHQNNSTR